MTKLSTTTSECRLYIYILIVALKGLTDSTLTRARIERCLPVYTTRCYHLHPNVHRNAKRVAGFSSVNTAPRRDSGKILLLVACVCFLIRLRKKKLSSRREAARCFVSLNISLSYSSSLKVIRNATVGKLGYGFLFAFHGNNGSVLYHFRAKARYWSKIAICSYPGIRRPR